MTNFNLLLKHEMKPAMNKKEPIVYRGTLVAKEQIDYEEWAATHNEEFVDARDMPEDCCSRLVKSNATPLRFDWENKWLRGDQYAHMLCNIDQYCKTFGMEKLAQKQHPENIYV